MARHEESLAEEYGAVLADFNGAFLDESGTLSRDIMPDLLHPNAAGYEIWAEQLKPYVEKYVGR